MQRVVMPAGLKFFQLRGEPLARMLLPKYRNDPYPLYAEIRERGPVRNPLGIWAIGSHAGVSTVLRDTHGFSHNLSVMKKPPTRSGHPDDPTVFVPSNQDLLLMLDPPDH